MNFNQDAVLTDTIDTCLILAKRGAGSADSHKKYEELQKGIKAFGTGYLMEGNFRMDEAIPAAARVAYLAAKILAGNLSPLVRFEEQEIKTPIPYHSSTGTVILNFSSTGWIIHQTNNSRNRVVTKSKLVYPEQL